MKFRVLSCLIAMSLICTFFTSCHVNKREDVSHSSKEEIIDFVNKMVQEPVSFLSVKEENADKIVYTFMLDSRNIEFEVYDVISNHGLNIDATQFYDDYRQTVFVDYKTRIVEDYADRRKEIASKYNITEEIYDTLGCYCITIDNYNGLRNLADYIVACDKLYSFNVRVPKSSVVRFQSECDVISFADTELSINCVDYSLSNDERLTSDAVYEKLIKTYIEQLTYFGLTDENIPQSIMDKYAPPKENDSKSTVVDL